MPNVPLRPIERDEVPLLRDAAERYWAELMPHAPVVRDPVRREAFFREHFALDNPASSHWWTVTDDERVGFLKVDRWENHDGPGATIRDFFIEPDKRRQGFGSAAVRSLLDLLRAGGVHHVDLHVHADNPTALAFWHSVGFDLSLYQLRMYLE